MSAILFSPHNDDETLFAFYQCLRHKPIVVIVLRSFKQAHEQNGPDFAVREAETVCAMEIAGVPAVFQWGWSDMAPPWDIISREAAELVTRERPDRIIAPAFEHGGHEHHNAVASFADGISAVHRIPITRYLTYQRGEGRSMDGHEVLATDAESDAKLTALGCYSSQAEHPPTAPWFNPHHYGDLREWIA